MKKIMAVCVLGLFSFSSFSEIEKSELDQKLDTLNIPTDRVSPVVSKENLYIVNKRYSSLRRRHELTFSGAKNFNADSHLETNQLGATYRFHLNADWSFGLRHTQYNNELSSAGKQLFERREILPDSDFALKSTSGFVNYNTIYGKLRMTKNTIVYFDQYIALGYGKIDLASGETNQVNLDLGFSFWLGKNFSSRVGLNNEFYTQQKLEDETNVHNMMGYVEFGYLFGEGSRI